MEPVVWAAPFQNRHKNNVDAKQMSLIEKSTFEPLEKNMAAKETLDQREYVVQYRKKGAKEWCDSHVQTFLKIPGRRQIEKEIAETAEDLISFVWNKKLGMHTVKLRDDYEGRVILVETSTRETQIGKILTFKKEFLLDSIKKTENEWKPKPNFYGILLPVEFSR